MRWHLVLALLLGFCVATLSAQDQKPNFSGAWVMVSPKPGTPLTIKQDGATFAYGSDDAHTLTVRLNGSESLTPMPIGTVTSKASWDGSRLVIINAITRPEGNLNQVLGFVLSADGQLSMTIKNGDGEPTTLTYKRKGVD